MTFADTTSVRTRTCLPVPGAPFRGCAIRTALALLLLVAAPHAPAIADELISGDLGVRNRRDSGPPDPLRVPMYLQSAEEIRKDIAAVHLGVAPVASPTQAPGAAAAPDGTPPGVSRLHRDAGTGLRGALARQLRDLTPGSQPSGALGAAGPSGAQDQAQAMQLLTALQQAPDQVLALVPLAVSEAFAPDSERKLRSPLLEARKRGIRLRRKPATTAGDADPATLTYTRNWEPEAGDPGEVFEIEFGLTFEAGIRSLRRSREQHILMAPLAWVGGDLRTGQPDKSNWYGVGVASSFVFADDASLCEGANCCTRMLELAVEADWTKSQDGKTQKFTVGATANPIYAPLCLGHRCSLGAIDWDWVFKPSVKLVHTTDVGGSRETGSTTGRAQFSLSARFWLTSLARVLGLDAAKQSPMVILTYSGYALLDAGEYLDHFRGSLNIPLPDVTRFPNAFSLEIAYERGTQAPVSFRRAENLQVALGIRF